VDNHRSRGPVTPRTPICLFHPRPPAGRSNR